MVDKTVRNLIADIERELRQVSGPSVQVYDEPLIIGKIQSKFDTIFAERYWERHRTFETGTLDGVAGQTTGTFTQIVSFQDIDKVFPSDSDLPLQAIPRTVNPGRFYGNYPRFFGPNAVDGKLIKVYPLTATGDVTISGRAYPAQFNVNSTVPFDYLCIVYAVCAEIANDDGLNPGMANKFDSLYQDRLQVMIDQEPDAIALNPYKVRYPTSWYSPDEG